MTPAVIHSRRGIRLLHQTAADFSCPSAEAVGLRGADSSSSPSDGGISCCARGMGD